MRELTDVDRDRLRDELPQVEEHLARFDNLPSEIREHLDKLKSELG